jgi:hypothetical protein
MWAFDLNPDADQLTRDIMPLGKRIQALPGNERATCRLNSMLWERCLAIKPSSPCQITNLNLSGPRGALQRARIERYQKATDVNPPL